MSGPTGEPPSDEQRRTPPAWTGVGIAIGAGIGMTVGVLVGGGAGLSMGLAIGAGLGVAIGAAIDSRRRPSP